jgi:tripeptidyl-peptidase-1
MRYHWHPIPVLSVISIAAVPLACYAKPLSRRWDNMHTKHSWNTVPEDWESLGHPSAGTTINLHVALKPDRESALIHALYEVSDPGHPKHVLSTTPSLTDVLTSATAGM